MTRDDAARALLSDCGTAYTAFTPAEDLGSQQTVATYQNFENQRKYVHMYFAKQVTLWRRVRAAVEHRDSPLWSVGAGPMLDLFGWFWDAPPDGTRVVACDVLPWTPLRDLASWTDLAACTVGGSYEYNAGVAVPDPRLLPQCAGLSVASLESAQIENGATVLIPFMLNHLVGRNSPTDVDGRAALRAWVDDVRSREGRLIIADLHASSASDFWRDLTATLGVEGPPKDYKFPESIGEIADLYPDVATIRFRRRSQFISLATVLVVEPNSAWFLQ